MPKKRAQSAVPEVQEPQQEVLDLVALKANMVARANAEVPAWIKAMNGEQCRAYLRRKYPAMRAWEILREPGEDG